MARSKPRQRDQSQPAAPTVRLSTRTESDSGAAEAAVRSPYLPVAHPPAKNPPLLAISVLLFVSWFLFLACIAIWG